MAGVTYSLWNQPREYNSVRAKYRHCSHCRFGFEIWMCGNNPSFTAHFWNESSLSRHQENVVFWRFPKVSLQICVYGIRTSKFGACLTLLQFTAFHRNDQSSLDCKSKYISTFIRQTVGFYTGVKIPLKENSIFTLTSLYFYSGLKWHVQYYLSKLFFALL